MNSAVCDLALTALPPMLEAALGYSGLGRWVAFYWEPKSNDVICEDGLHDQPGCWQAWLIFTQHYAIWPALRGFNYGTSTQPAEYWLVLDRQARKLRACTRDFARAFLKRQWHGERLAASQQANPAQTQGACPINKLLAWLYAHVESSPASAAL